MTRRTSAPRSGFDVLIGVSAALALGYVAARAAGSSRDGAVFLLLPTISIVLSIFFGLKRTLLAIAVFGIPFQWDVNYFYDSDAAAHGAIGGVSVSITTLALVGLYAVWIVDLLLDPRDTPHPRLKCAAPAFIYLALTAVSLAVAENHGLTWFELALIAQGVLLFVYVASTVRSSENLRLVIGLVVGALALQASLIVLQYYTGATIEIAGLRARTDIDEAVRAAGTVGSPNTAGSFLAPSLVIATGLLVARSVSSSRRLAALGVAIGAVALVVTFSRGAWIAFAISIAVLMLILWSQRQLTGRVVLVAAVVSVVGLVLGGEIGARLTSQAGGADSREALATVALDVIHDHALLGVGANNYVVALPDYAPLTQYAYIPHNKFLLVWAESGLGALVAFVIFVGVSLRRGWVALRAADASLLPYVAVLSAALVALLVHMNFEPFHGRAQVMFLFLIAGLLHAPGSYGSGYVGTGYLARRNAGTHAARASAIF